MIASERRLCRACFDTPAGRLTVAVDSQAVCSLSFGGCAHNDCTALLRDAEKQISEYFSGKRRKFDLPLKLSGSPFQLRVWNELLNIPYGQTASYSEIARILGNPKACRAVGNANNKNPIPLLVPCHRVVGKNGSLTGYAGGIEFKKFLLDLEKGGI